MTGLMAPGQSRRPPKKVNLLKRLVRRFKAYIAGVKFRAQLRNATVADFCCPGCRINRDLKHRPCYKYDCGCACSPRGKA